MSRMLLVHLDGFLQPVSFRLVLLLAQLSMGSHGIGGSVPGDSANSISNRDARVR
jgi:hypothetical protein